MHRITRRRFNTRALQLAAACLAGCRRSTPPFLRKEPIKSPLIVENHSEMLAHWAEQGVKDAVLLNFDEHDDIRRIPDRKTAALRKIYAAKNWPAFRQADTTGDRGLYNLGNWIYAGARLGIIREVCWVVPVDLPTERHQEDDPLRKILRHYDFPEEVISTFTAKGNRYFGSFDGIPMTICGPNGLPDISRPLLLSIDLDFFPLYANNRRKSILRTVQDSFLSLFQQNYQILRAAFCYSTEYAYLNIEHRWIGEAVAAILADPSLVDRAPTEQLALFQKLEDAYIAKDAAGILNLINISGALADHPSVRVYEICAYMARGEAEKAFTTAELLCRNRKEYCQVFPLMALFYLKNGQEQLAERFFRAGFRLNPGLNSGLADFANFLRNSGRPREALNYLGKIVEFNGAFPYRLVMVNLLLELQDQHSAHMQLQQAVAALAENEYARVKDRQVADDIHAVIKHCEEAGMRTEAAALLRDPRIIRMYKKFTPGHNSR